MKTTALFIEYMVAGTLILLAVIFWVVLFFPSYMETILIYLEGKSLPVSVLLTTVFIAIAYGAGICTEVFGLWLFEWKHNRIKKKWLREYLKDFEENDVDIAKSSILRPLKGIPPDRITEKHAKSCIGPMRFYVLMESSKLYQDIAYQLHRLRLIRILFIAEVIALIAVCVKLLQTLLSHQDISYYVGALILLTALVIATYIAIVHHFNRYCRAVLRSYVALVFDKDQDTGKEAPPHIDSKIQMKIKRVNTEIAHQNFSTPLVGIVVFLLRDKKVALFKHKDSEYKLPESYARGDQELEEAIHSTLHDYLSNMQEVTIESCTLLSGEGYREDVYQCNYVAFVRIEDFVVNPNTEMIWVSEPPVDTPVYLPHKKLLEEYFSKRDLKDRIVVPHDPAKRLGSDKEKLKKTKKIHAECAQQFPMPQITVDGLLLKFSDDTQCQFEGIILEKRSKDAKREPEKWAFPAGFVNAHEAVSEALAYEVFEEVGIVLQKDNFLSVYKYGTGPHRDPKWFVWTQFLVVYTRKEPTVASDEIEDVRVFPVSEIPWNEMAFDHGDILKEFIDNVPRYVKRVIDMICP